MYGIPLIIVDLSSDLWAAFIGALIGGGFSLAATYWAIRTENKRQKANEDAANRDFLLSIKDELNSVWTLYYQNVGQHLEQSIPGEAFQYRWKADHNYFIIYESNLGLLPKIRNAEIRQQIIVTYTYAKSLVDTLHLNTSMVLEYAELERKSRAIGEEGARYVGAMIEMKDSLNSYRDTLFSIHLAAKSSFDRLIHAIK